MPLGANTLALADPANRPAARIQDVAWLAGRWQGSAFGETTEEIWSSPLGRNMVGIFRITKGDDAGMYEFITLTEDAGSLEMRTKHFGADMKGWEEKDDCVRYRLVKLAPNEAWFENLTFKRPEPDTLEIYLTTRTQEGAVGEQKFTFQRLPEP
ncbi:MAG: hypothetical protein KIT09_07430 [Bryobacteraceae bacterium]|nr:hypothetical protein [Bryobacteraceae bacterium]